MVMKPLLILLLAANTPQVTGETLRGQRKLQGLNAIAGYMPGSQVDDHVSEPHIHTHTHVSHYFLFLTFPCKNHYCVCLCCSFCVRLFV